MWTGDRLSALDGRPARRGGGVRWSILVVALLVAGGAAAQPTAPPPVPAPPTPTADSAGLPSPGGAVLRAAVLPGWGQVYSGQPLKAPFAAAAVAGAVVYAADRQRQYLLFRRAALYAGCVEDPTRIILEDACDAETIASARDEWIELGEPSFAAVAPVRNQARGQRDIGVLVVGVVYAVQVLDAYVAAHLAGFDVSEDLSLRAAPEQGGLALRVQL